MAGLTVLQPSTFPKYNRHSGRSSNAKVLSRSNPTCDARFACSPNAKFKALTRLLWLHVPHALARILEGRCTACVHPEHFLGPPGNAEHKYPHRGMSRLPGAWTCDLFDVPTAAAYDSSQHAFRQKDQAIPLLTGTEVRRGVTFCTLLCKPLLAS